MFVAPNLREDYGIITYLRVVARVTLLGDNRDHSLKWRRIRLTNSATPSSTIGTEAAIVRS